MTGYWACDLNFVRGEDSFGSSMGRQALGMADIPPTTPRMRPIGAFITPYGG